jgi:transcriptional regulator
MQVEWRRTKVLELLSKGDSQSDIAKTLQVDLSIISRDVIFSKAAGAMEKRQGARAVQQGI